MSIAMPWLPAAKIVPIEGRGEFFVRHHEHADATAPTVLLLHGWTASSDLQFVTAYEALAERYSFVGIDHRGHGRGLRSPDPFTLDDVADDAVAVARALGVDRAILIGYSMGGPIGLTLARRHPEFVDGIVVQATALEWNASWRDRLQWRFLPVMGAALRSVSYPRLMRRFFDRFLPVGHPLAPYIDWLRGESQRADPHTVIEAGRALGDYDATKWAPGLGMPAASLITTGDRLVKPRKQRALAAALNAPVREIAADHLCPWEQPVQFASVTVDLVDVVVAAATSAVPVSPASPVSTESVESRST